MKIEVAQVIWNSSFWLKGHSDVIMKASSRWFIQRIVQAEIKEDIKAACHWPLWWESTGDRWIPLTKGQWCGKKFHLMKSWEGGKEHALIHWRCKDPINQLSLYWLICQNIFRPQHLAAAISQTINSDTLLWLNSLVFWFKFHWSLFLRVQLIIMQNWLR